MTTGGGAKGMSNQAILKYTAGPFQKMERLSMMAKVAQLYIICKGDSLIVKGYYSSQA
jgi:hypothetical protein